MIIDQYKKMKNLFLRQSYIDAWEDYQRSIRKRSFAQWDYIVLTASNEEQANAFRSQITYRQNKNVLPCKTKYLVLPDPDGKRVGSGGATLQVLRKLAEQEDIAGDFHNKRILVIHSGGDSKRVPQYSVCGKLFSPVPRELPDGRASTLFDEFLIGMAGVPSRFREGMLVLSGDVLLLFNPLQIDAQFHGAAAISMKSPVDVAPNFSSIALTKSKSSTTVMLSRALIMSSLESAIIINYPPMAFDSTRQQGLQLLQLHPASSRQ